MSPWMQPISHNLIVKTGLAEKWNHKDIKGQNCSVSGLISFISCRAPQAPDRKVPAVIRQSSWLKAWTAKAIISVPVRGGVVLWNECFLHRNAITARRCDKNIWEPQYCVSKQKYLGNLSGQWRLGRFVELDYDYKNFDIQQWANKWKFRKSKLFSFFSLKGHEKCSVCVPFGIFLSAEWIQRLSSPPNCVPHHLQALTSLLSCMLWSIICSRNHITFLRMNVVIRFQWIIFRRHLILLNREIDLNHYI